MKIGAVLVIDTDKVSVVVAIPSVTDKDIECEPMSAVKLDPRFKTKPETRFKTGEAEGVIVSVWQQVFGSCIGIV